MTELDTLFQQLAIESQKSLALGNAEINLENAEKGFPLKDVSLYETKAELFELDSEGNETDKTYFAPIITLCYGKEIQLTESENKTFGQLWNLKAQIDMRVIGIIYALEQLQYPPQRSLEGGK